MPGEAFQRAMRGAWPLLTLVAVVIVLLVMACFCGAVVDAG